MHHRACVVVAVTVFVAVAVHVRHAYMHACNTIPCSIGLWLPLCCFVAGVVDDDADVERIFAVLCCWWWWWWLLTYMCADYWWWLASHWWSWWWWHCVCVCVCGAHRRLPHSTASQFAFAFDREQIAHTHLYPTYRKYCPAVPNYPPHSPHRDWRSSINTRAFARLSAAAVLAIVRGECVEWWPHKLTHTHTH